MSNKKRNSYEAKKFKAYNQLLEAKKVEQKRLDALNALEGREMPAGIKSGWLELLNTWLAEAQEASRKANEAYMSLR